MEINNLYTAFVEVLAARQTLSYTKASVAGLDVLLQKTQLLYEKDLGSRADVNEVKTQRQVAEVGVLDAEENLRKAKRTLGMMLNLAPDQAESFDVRGSIQDRGPAPPPLDELVRIALSMPAGRRWPTGLVCRPRSQESAWQWPIATRTLTCCISLSPIRTTLRSASRPHPRGPWA